MRKFSSILALSLFVVAGAASLAAQPSPIVASFQVAGGLTRPVFCGAPPGDLDRLFIVERTEARIRILRNGSLLATPFIDLDPVVINATNDQGLLGLAFHPHYSQNGRFFVFYIDNAGMIVVAEHHVSATNPDVANPNPAAILLTLSHPSTAANGGMLAFSPINGYLYIGIGDGSATNDPQNRAQDLNDLHGKILRIDVDSQSPGLQYGIPPSNPFAGAIPGRDEIWAYGLHNPWKFSFDRANGDLYIGDRGATSREEVDWEPASSGGGRNYGWRCMEGNVCTGLSGCTCGSAGLTAPIRTYGHTGNNCAVVGGYVYRGCAINGLQGAYFHSDHCGGRIWTLRHNNGTVTELIERTFEMIPPPGQNLASMSSYGEDGRGELYICSLIQGTVFKIGPASVVPLTSITLGGTPSIGSTVPVNLSSPADPNRGFLCGFSSETTPPVVLPDDRVIALAVDDLLLLSLQPGNPFFLNSAGSTLNGSGAATVQVVIPNLPVLSGLSIYSAFVVLDPLSPAGVRRISCPLTITLQ